MPTKIKHPLVCVAVVALLALAGFQCLSNGPGVADSAPPPVLKHPAKPIPKIKLLLFTEDNCVYCKQLESAFHEKAIAAELSRFDLEVHKNETSDRYTFNGYPTLILVDDAGKERSRFTGFRGASYLLQWLRSF